jgi:hypothetical protein
LYQAAEKSRVCGATIQGVGENAMWMGVHPGVLLLCATAQSWVFLVGQKHESDASE